MSDEDEIERETLRDQRKQVLALIRYLLRLILPLNFRTSLSPVPDDVMTNSSDDIVQSRSYVHRLVLSVNIRIHRPINA